MNKLFFSIITLFFVGIATLNAQDFSWHVKIKPVSEKGYYQIVFPPQFRAKADKDLNDLRLFANDSLEKPYAIYIEKPVTTTTQRLQLPEISRTPQTVWKKSNLVVENSALDTISEFFFRVPSSVFDVRIKVLGAYTENQWQNIYSFRLTNDFYSKDSINLSQYLNAPSAFKFYSFQYRSFQEEPFNIGNVFYEKQHLQKGIYLPIDSVEFEQQNNTENKQTLVLIKVPEKQHIDQVRIKLKNEPEFYERELMIAIPKLQRNKKFVYHSDRISYTLTKEGEKAFNTDFFYTNELHLIITNNDNQPLEIERIELLQLQHSLIAMLEPETEYTLKMGAINLKQPVYDIYSQTDTLVGKLPQAELAELLQITRDEKQKTSLEKAQESNLLVWIAIALVGGLLLFLSTKMIKEIKNKH